MLKRIISVVILALVANIALGQGSQLPKFTVATLPSASTLPTYAVQVIDGAMFATNAKMTTEMILFSIFPPVNGRAAQ